MITEFPTDLKAINQSQLKAWRHCQRLWKYKYEERIIPKAKARPLFLGSWVHAALESHYRDGDWKIGHALYVEQWNKLFDEEREYLSGKSGPLPDLVQRIMKSYLWYYREDGWKPKIIEEVFDVTLKGVRFKGRLDLVIEDDKGDLWLVDHKTASTIPQPTSFHAMDPQLILYPWAAQKMWGIEIKGVIYNYVRSRAPSIPSINKNGSLSKRKIVTDYPTLRRFLKENGYDPREFSDTLRPLAKRSEFLRRYKLPREDTVLRNILQEAIWTGRDIYNHRTVTRNITRDCVKCGYQAICRADLNGLDTTKMRERDFEIEEDSYLDHGDDNPTQFFEEEDEHGYPGKDTAGV